MHLILVYLIGVIFGTGIVISGMANPAKVINFFDVAGSWDPSLAFVMGGALITAAIGYRLVFGRARPLFEGEFNIPTARNLDARLIAARPSSHSAGGIAGFLPGGALPRSATGPVGGPFAFNRRPLLARHSSPPATCKPCSLANARDS